MKKNIFIISLIFNLFIQLFTIPYTLFPAHAQSTLDIVPNAPSGLGINPRSNLGGVTTNALTIIYIISSLLTLFFVVWGAFNYITSGGDKEKIAGARKMIITALVGLALLALAYFLVRIVGSLLNIDLLNLGNLPRLGPAPSGP